MVPGSSFLHFLPFINSFIAFFFFTNAFFFRSSKNVEKAKIKVKSKDKINNKGALTQCANPSTLFIGLERVEAAQVLGGCSRCRLIVPKKKMVTDLPFLHFLPFIHFFMFTIVLLVIFRSR